MAFLATSRTQLEAASQLEVAAISTIQQQDRITAYLISSFLRCSTITTFKNFFKVEKSRRRHGQSTTHTRGKPMAIELFVTLRTHHQVFACLSGMTALQIISLTMTCIAGHGIVQQRIILTKLL